MNILSTTEVTETSFVVNWSANTTDIRNITIKVALDDSFQQLQSEVNVQDISQKSQRVDGLKGATYYYVKVMMDLNSGDRLESSSKTVITSFQDEGVNLTTSDGLNITGRIKFLNSSTDKQPAIVFMHQFMCLGNYWNGSETLRKCVARGWVCLVINFRGHFSSDPWQLPTTLDGMYDYVGLCSLDAEAAVDFLRNDSRVDPDRIALVGASLGANVSLEDNCLDGVVTSVALTPSLVMQDTLCSGIPLRSVLYLCGEYNVPAPPAPNYPADTRTLYNNTQEPRELLMLPLKDHGWDMLNPELEDQIVDWLDARFTE